MTAARFRVYFVHLAVYYAVAVSTQRVVDLVAFGPPPLITAAGYVVPFWAGHRAASRLSALLAPKGP